VARRVPRLRSQAQPLSVVGGGAAEARGERRRRAAHQPLVDAYNAVSLHHVLPAGGEDSDRLVGRARLALADGSEDFIVLGGGAEVVDHPEPGEVVWADEHSVTCRRWSWRQCRRTQLTEASSYAYFLLERLAPYPLDEIEDAAEALRRSLLMRTPGAALELERIGPGWSAAGHGDDPSAAAR
jgi:DNA/RNA-binding domain of Phe-tRNA-synthetase-like protein